LIVLGKQDALNAHYARDHETHARILDQFARDRALLPQIASQLEIMLASATQHTDGEAVTGYTIKTGALHRIIGLLVGAGYRVIVPSEGAEIITPR
jgi:hypothetical protein